jgi:hypothetical protein
MLRDADAHVLNLCSTSGDAAVLDAAPVERARWVIANAFSEAEQQHIDRLVQPIPDALAGPSPAGKASDPMGEWAERIFYELRIQAADALWTSGCADYNIGPILEEGDAARWELAQRMAGGLADLRQHVVEEVTSAFVAKARERMTPATQHDLLAPPQVRFKAPVLQMPDGSTVSVCFKADLHGSDAPAAD